MAQSGRRHPLGRFGEVAALELLPVVKALEMDFYASTARDRAPTLAEMGKQAAADFTGQTIASDGGWSSL